MTAPDRAAEVARLLELALSHMVSIPACVLSGMLCGDECYCDAVPDTLCVQCGCGPAPDQHDDACDALPHVRAILAIVRELEARVVRLTEVMEVVAAPYAINGSDHASAVKHARDVLKETDADERELRELMAKATPQPWRLLCDTVWSRVDAHDEAVVIDSADVGPFDAALITAAVNSLPRHLDTIATLRAQLASAEATIVERLELSLGAADAHLAELERVKADRDGWRREAEQARLGVEALHDLNREANARLATAQQQLGAAKTLADSWALNSGGYYGLPYSAAAKQLRAALTAPADKETTDGDT